MGLRDVIVLQNKIDLCESRQEIEDHYRAICDLTDKYECTRDSVVVPISAQLGYNIDAVLQMLAEVIPQPRPRHQDHLRMTVVRSFDVNKPGASFTELKGGVAGGTIHEGTLQLGDVIEIRPGLIVQQGGRKMYKPLQSTVTSLFSEQQSLEQAQAGGLIGVGTMLDPSLARADGLLGQVIGLADHMPPVVDALIVNVTRIQMFDQERIEFENGQIVMLHIGASSIKAKIVEKKTKNKEKLTLELQMPVCVNLDEDRITASVQVLKSWRLVGFASIVNGREVDRAK
jgi:translation initiation factor 2 subunit 3